MAEVGARKGTRTGVSYPKPACVSSRIELWILRRRESLPPTRRQAAETTPMLPAARPAQAPCEGRSGARVPEARVRTARACTASCAACQVGLAGGEGFDLGKGAQALDPVERDHHGAALVGQAEGQPGLGDLEQGLGSPGVRRAWSCHRESRGRRQWRSRVLRGSWWGRRAWGPL